MQKQLANFLVAGAAALPGKRGGVNRSVLILDKI